MDKLKAREIIERLKQAFPDAHCELEFSTPFELLVATILSAQCTDKRVNRVTEELFKKVNTPQGFADMDYSELEPMIYSCGFYKNKAKNIIECSRAILVEHNGEVPANFDKLLKLPGVGRKTANVVMANAFGGNNIAVDTHVFRTSHRLGFSSGKTPHEVERDLINILDEDIYSLAHHLLIFHGRYTCKSRTPDCGECTLKEFCKHFGET